jgi:hypothetical protein
VSDGDAFPFEAAVREVVALLVRGEYAALEVLSRGVRLGADDLARAVREYPATLALPPAGRELPLGVYEHRGAVPRSWGVDADLWSIEEGRSDLTLQLTVRERPDGRCTIEIDGLHVL